MRSAVRTASRATLAAAGAAALTLGLASSASAATVDRTINDGGTPYTLSVTAPSTAPASGANVNVTGSGYNQSQGIYVGLCAVPAGVDVNDKTTWNSKPTPCLGGQDEAGSTGASHWINNTWYWMSPNNSSPYTDGANGTGTFHVNIHVKAKISASVTCGQGGVTCAIVTRADHFDSNDRKYDVYVPVTFS